MRRTILIAVRIAFFWTAVLGLAYPLSVTALAQVLFPGQANGRLVRRDSVVIGSALIGQPFVDPRYFWSRPSATGPGPFNAAASTGSNLGPTNPALEAAVRARIEALHASGTVPAGAAIPVDLVTASASGLDPDLSPAAVLVQCERVARARGIPVTTLRGLVQSQTVAPSMGWLGEPHVNVLALNLALDALHTDR